MPSIFERDRAGETIHPDDPGYPALAAVIAKATRKTAELNTLVSDDPARVRDIFSEITAQEIDPSFYLIPPFYTDFGENIRIGKNVFVNHACTFMDRGGITLEDNVLIGPKVNLITTNHPLNPAERRATISHPIHIGRNAWIGAAATVLPGVTIGENAIVAAGAVVTTDVPPNTVVAGVPAKVIRSV
jgi:acetyltransferase-like isoleucine patch superfamily enzyme